MTISSTTNRVTYTGNAVTDAFAVTYPFLLAADLKVYQAGTLKALTTHYTVTGGSGSPGTVTFGTAPGSGDEIVILRDPAVTQGLDLVENDPLPAEELEKAFDKLTMISQRNRDLLNRSMVLPDSDISGASTTLPEPASNEILMWNAAADALTSATVDTLAQVVASGTPVVETFDGGGSTFTLAGPAGTLENIDLYISGVHQVPTTDFTYSESTQTITTTSATPAGTGNVLVKYVGDQAAIATPADASVTPAKLSTGAPTWTSGGTTYIGGSSTAPGMKVLGVSTQVDYLYALPANAGGAVRLLIDGATSNVNMALSSKGTGSVDFYTNGANAPQVSIQHTALSERVVTLTGAPAGGDPKIATSAGSLDIGAPVVLTSQTVGTTVGAAGGASALPATPLGYLTVSINGTACKIPYYN